MSIVTFCDAPQRADPKAKTRIAPTMIGRRPKIDASPAADAMRSSQSRAYVKSRDKIALTEGNESGRSERVS